MVHFDLHSDLNAEFSPVQWRLDHIQRLSDHSVFRNAQGTNRKISETSDTESFSLKNVAKKMQRKIFKLFKRDFKELKNRPENSLRPSRIRVRVRKKGRATYTRKLPKLPSTKNLVPICTSNLSTGNYFAAISTRVQKKRTITDAVFSLEQVLRIWN